MDWLDDIIKVSDSRLYVCLDLDDLGALSRRLFSALRHLEPDCITDAQYSWLEKSFRVQFGDGLSGTWPLDDMQLGLLPCPVHLSNCFKTMAVFTTSILA